MVVKKCILPQKEEETKEKTEKVSPARQKIKICLCGIFLRSSGWFYVRVAKRIANIRFEMMIASDTVSSHRFLGLEKDSGIL